MFEEPSGEYRNSVASPGRASALQSDALMLPYVRVKPSPRRSDNNRPVAQPISSKLEDAEGIDSLIPATISRNRSSSASDSLPSLYAYSYLDKSR